MSRLDPAKRCRRQAKSMYEGKCCSPCSQVETYRGGAGPCDGPEADTVFVVSLVDRFPDSTGIDDGGMKKVWGLQQCA